MLNVLSKVLFTNILSVNLIGVFILYNRDSLNEIALDFLRYLSSAANKGYTVLLHMLNYKIFCRLVVKLVSKLHVMAYIP